MKQDGWISEYQKNKFLEAHKPKLYSDDFFKDKRKSAVVIMLDVQGTINGLDDEKAKLFMEQLHRLRIKYNANCVVINLSSHVFSSKSLIPYLEILNRNLKPNILLDDATFLYGTYNYQTGVEETKAADYNLRKTKTFEDKYFGKYKVLCHGIIDDSVDTEYAKKYQNERPVFVIRASQSSETDLNRDNMMCYSTLTNGFDGVLECMDKYLERIKNVPGYSILEEQQRELVHLSAWEVKTMCIKKNFDLVLQYVSESKLDEDDYERVARELGFILEKEVLSSDELNKIRKIIESLRKYLEKDNEYLLSLRNKVNSL